MTKQEIDNYSVYRRLGNNDYYLSKGFLIPVTDVNFVNRRDNPDNYRPTFDSTQGFSYLSEVGPSGLLNLRKKAFGSSKLEKLELDCHFKWIKNHIRT